LVQYSSSSSSAGEGEEAHVESPNNLTWDDSILHDNEIPDNIDEFINDFLFNVDNSTVELVDLSQNTLQLLEDFTNELTGNPSPPPPPAFDTLTSPLRTTEVEHSPDIVEQLGGGDNIQEGEGVQLFPIFN
jgi:hypothetical protein